MVPVTVYLVFTQGENAMKVFCRDCKEETNAIKIVDEDNSSILYCSRCGGDDVTTEYMECDLCGTINAHEDVHCSDFPEAQNICSNCVESARKEFFQLSIYHEFLHQKVQA